MPKTKDRKPADQKKTSNVSVWLSAKEREMIDAIAEADGDQSAGAFLRRIGLREARLFKESEDAGVAVERKGRGR